MHRIVRATLFPTILLALGARAQTSINPITTVAGGGSNSSAATSALLPLPSKLAVDNAGNVLVVSWPLGQVYKFSISGSLTLVAGNGTAGFSGDGGPATQASLSPYGVAVDSGGNVFITDSNYVRRVNVATGIITTVAGNGNWDFSGDGGPAISATLKGPRDVAIDAGGDLFIADTSNHRIRRVNTATGIISTVAGNGTQGFGGDGGQAVNGALAYPSGVVLDKAGNLFIADMSNARIRRVDAATGVITTVAGGGSGDDGSPATDALVAFPAGVAVDSVGNLLIAETNAYRIRRVDAATHIITTIAGNGMAGFSGDGGPAVDASLSYVLDVAVDSAGNVFIPDSDNNRVRRVEAETGTITTVAGGGIDGDGGPATSALLASPHGVAEDAEGSLLIADVLNQRVRKVDAASGVITTVAGNGVAGFSGDGGPALDASLNSPRGVAADSAGNVFIADTLNGRIRRVDAATGVMSTVAGNGVVKLGCAEVGGLAVDTSLLTPTGAVVDGEGNLFIADSGHDCVRRVDALTGVITTVAGNGYSGSSGDGGPAALAEVGSPTSLALDRAGNLFISQTGGNRVRRVDAATGVITTVAGRLLSPGFSGDGGPATEASLYYPWGVAVDTTGNLFIADTSNNRVRRVDAATGLITTVAGNGGWGFSGDGGPATSARVTRPTGVAVGRAGGILVADTSNNRIRKVTMTAGLGLSASALEFPNRIVGTTITQPIDVTSAGGAPLQVASITLAGDFTQTNDCPISPATLNPGSGCIITVTFAPTAVGTSEGNITITDNAPGSPHTVTLTGSGADFSLAAAPGSTASATVNPGGTANYDLQLAPAGFSGTVALACAFEGTTPRGARCAVSPESVAVNGADPAPFTASVTTTARALALPQIGGHPRAGGDPVLPMLPWERQNAPFLLGLLLPILVAVGMVPRLRGEDAGHREAPVECLRRRSFGPLLLAAVLCALLLWAACGGETSGGGGNTGTPPGTYTLTVTGTYTSGSTSISRTLDLTLKVN